MVDDVIREFHGRLSTLENWKIEMQAARLAETKLSEERHETNVKAIARVENISHDNHELLTELLRRTERQAGSDEAKAKDEAKSQERQAKYGKVLAWFIGILATMASGDWLGHLWKR